MTLSAGKLPFVATSIVSLHWHVVMANRLLSTMLYRSDRMTASFLFLRKQPIPATRDVW